MTNSALDKYGSNPFAITAILSLSPLGKFYCGPIAGLRKDSFRDDVLRRGEMV